MFDAKSAAGQTNLAVQVSLAKSYPAEGLNPRSLMRKTSTTTSVGVHHSLSKSPYRSTKLVINNALDLLGGITVTFSSNDSVTLERHNPMTSQHRIYHLCRADRLWSVGALSIT